MRPLLAELNFALEYPWLLLLWLLIPILAVLKGRRGPTASVQFSSLHILNRMGPAVRSRAGGLRSTLLYLTFALLVFALARPQKIHSTVTRTESGVEMIVAIDVSLSMQVEDFLIRDAVSTDCRRRKRSPVISFAAAAVIASASSLSLACPISSAP